VIIIRNLQHDKETISTAKMPGHQKKLECYEVIDPWLVESSVTN